MSAVNTLVEVASQSVVVAGCAGGVAGLTLLYGAAVGGKARVAAAFAGRGAVGVGTEELGVVGSLPARLTLVLLAEAGTEVAGVVAGRLGLEGVVDELVLDVGLVGVLVNLDDEAVARFVVHWVDHARKCNCDGPCVAGIGCEYVGYRDETRVSFDHAVRVESA